MWYENHNGTDVQPAEIDETSSKRYVYVRKNFVRVEASGEGDERVEAHWTWQELKVKRDTWETTKIALENSAALRDVYGALTEVAEIAIGGDA